MREINVFEDLTNYYLESILETPIGELAAEYDVPVECINDLFTLADEIDSCFKRKLLSSEELRNEEVSRYKVVSVFTTRYYFKRYIVLLGSYLKSLAQISQELYNLGYTRMNGQALETKYILSVLRNPIYIGKTGYPNDCIMCKKKCKKKITAPNLLCEDYWNEVQKILDDKKWHI